MNEQRIREIANQCSDFAEQIPFFRGIENGLTWEATIQKARDLKFAELIVGECAQVSEDDIADGDACCTNTADRIARQIKKHFGVEE